MAEIKAFRQLVDVLSRLPGIGKKSAQRIAYYLLRQPESELKRLSAVIGELMDNIKFCQRCFNLSEDDLCSICHDPGRDPVICVVEDVRDLMAIDRMGEYSGRFHVLGGVISPLDGIGPDALKIKELLVRIREESIAEVILATNFTVEGEATAMYIRKLLSGSGVTVCRIAYGLPVGGSLEYADEATMAKALEGRKKI